MYSNQFTDLSGVNQLLGFDATAYMNGVTPNYLATGIPSLPQMQQSGVVPQQTAQLSQMQTLPSGSPIADQFSPSQLLEQEKKNQLPLWKKIGAGALGLYILGIICSKGKTNPIDGLIGIKKATCWLASKCSKFITGLFKKS